MKPLPTITLIAVFLVVILGGFSEENCRIKKPEDYGMFDALNCLIFRGGD